MTTADDIALPTEVASRLKGWRLARWFTPTGSVGFEWFGPGGFRQKIAAQRTEAEALRSALRWFAARDPQMIDTTQRRLAR